MMNILRRSDSVTVTDFDLALLESWTGNKAVEERIRPVRIYIRPEDREASSRLVRSLKSMRYKRCAT